MTTRRKAARDTAAGKELIDDKRLWAKLRRALADAREGRKTSLRDYLKNPS